MTGSRKGLWVFGLDGHVSRCLLTTWCVFNTTVSSEDNLQDGGFAGVLVLVSCVGHYSKHKTAKSYGNMLNPF